MPAFNAAGFLSETIASVLSQGFVDFELIVVDDCSNDNTVEVVSRFNDERIRYFRLEQNHGGPSRPRNIGVAAAHGRYISFFDSDDIMLPGKLAASVAALQAFPPLAMVFTDAYRINENGQKMEGCLLQGYSGLGELLTDELDAGLFQLKAPDAFQLLFRENYIPTSSVMLRRSVLSEIGPFDESLVNGDDRDMWYRIARAYPLGFLSVPLHNYRVRRGSVSSRGVITARNRIAVLEKQIATGLPVALARQARHLIANNYYGIGYALRKQGDLGQARANYALSLRYQARLPTLRGYLATFLGARLLRLLRP